MNQQQIQRILIVGGGTAGWMSALFLRRRTGCDVTLIESPNIGTIGVGEATIPNLIDFLQSMEIDEDHFMRACQATYKLGIQFRDWVQKDSAYWHPFGLCGGNIDRLDLFHHWLKRRHELGAPEPYCHYSLQALLCEQGKSHRPLGSSPIVLNYAYHLNATAFGEMLSQQAMAIGVQRVLDDVVKVEMREGAVHRICTADSGEYEADLYIDCTGFRGLIIEQTLRDGWVDWSDVLLCDRAVVTRAEADVEMRPYTISTALDAGWAWQIPLANQSGFGYVYSSNHISDSKAQDSLKEYVGSSDIDARQLEFRVGHRENFWKANCISIGLASGFIEPLESTGIFFIQRALEELVTHFPDQRFEPTLLRKYNERMRLAYQEVRDFIVLHYVLSTREDTDFWIDARNVSYPSSLAQTLEFYRRNGRVLEAETDPVFRETNFYHVLAGGDCLPEKHDSRADFSDFDAVCKLFERIRSENEGHAASLPMHHQLIIWLNDH